MSLLLRALFPTFILSGIVPLRYGFFPLSSFFFCREDYLQEPLGLFFSTLGLGILPLSSLLLGSMVDSSEVRILCPSISVMPQFDWLCDVCGCVMSPTSGIYWIELGFINNCNKPQLWPVLLRYSADVTNAFPWVVTYGIKAGPIILCGLRDTTSQSGP